MSQAELLYWCSAYHAAPAPDEESEIVAQFLAAPYPYQNDDDQGQKQLGDDITAGSAYWPDHVNVTDPSAGACYWPLNAGSSNGDSNTGSGGGYVDDAGCYYYLGERDVSLGINTRAAPPCTSIDLNLLGDGEEERSASVQPLPVNPSLTDHIRVGHLDGGNNVTAASRPKRKVPAGREGGDLGGGRKKKASAPSKTAQKCVQEKAQSSSTCSGNESNSSEAHVGGVNVTTRASKGSATDPQSLYARRRRERINERLKILQKLVPNGTKVDICTMLEEAVQYVRFLQLQIKMLSSDEMWMYAPIAYNGMSLGMDLKISPT